MTPKHPEIWHSIIVGGGASGLMCAGSYAAPKLLIEHNVRLGAKLAVTGGGKCNFTNLSVRAADYESARKHFCKNALAAFKPQDFIRLLDAEKIPYHEKEAGQLFAQDAREIVRLLQRRARQNNTTFSCSTQALKISREKDLFCVETSKGKFYAGNVVVASGGLSYPALGATGFAFQTAKSLGLQTAALRPALVSLSAPAPWRRICRELAGNSCPAQITAGKHVEEGQLLFTHDGVSGPVVLQTSLYWREGETVRVNFLPGTDAENFLRARKNETVRFSKLLRGLLPEKIAKTLLQELDARAADAPKETLLAAAARLNRFEFVPSGTGGYTRAEVTAGGVDAGEINPSTMQCKAIPGLFFIGEALDVTGRLGGYNLHWAWASAFCAAKALAAR